MKKNIPKILVNILWLLLALSFLSSCRIFGDSFPIRRFFIVTPIESVSEVTADEMLQLTAKILESEQYECVFRESGYAYPYRCDHPHNDLYVLYSIEDEELVYTLRSTFIWDARRANERFDSGASALQARFLEDNLRAAQIYPYMYRDYRVTPEDSEVVLSTEQMIPIAVKIIESEEYKCTHYEDELPDIEYPGSTRHVEGHDCLHSQEDLMVHLKAINGHIFYTIRSTVPARWNYSAEARFRLSADALLSRFEAANYRVMQEN